MKILVTGTAGFIGFHLAKKLLEHGYEDGVTEYFKLLQVNIDKNVHKEWYYGESEISNREDATPVLYLKRERLSEGKV